MLETGIIPNPNLDNIVIENEDLIDEEKKLLTHPIVEKRLKNLELILIDDGVYSEIENIKDEGEFFQIQKKMIFEECESYIYFDKYDRALLYAARLKEKYPESNYLNAVIAYSYYKLYNARKNHKLSTVSSPPLNYGDKSFSDLLTAFNFARMRKLSIALYSFCQNNYNEKQKDPRFLIPYAIISKEMLDEKTFEMLKTKYIKYYPKGQYVNNFPNL